MTDESALRVTSRAIYEQLTAELGRAQSWLASHVDDLDSGAASAARTALKPDGGSVATGVAKLSPAGAITSRLYDGSLTWSRWSAYARELREAIGYHLRTMGAALPTWGRFWDEVVATTGLELGELGKELGTGLARVTTGLTDALPFVAVAVAALAVVYLVVVFRGKVAA